ncbi:hypothetical protein [Streptomyces sp. enrichment culture]|uniref:hypothetical protein n=1 Tax=Streptomyces sp. enrichment culture TaxID=1795815 RepID=UPI003F545569
MSVRMFRAKVKPEKVAEMEAAGKEMFAAIEAAQPKGVRYTWCKLQDGETFLLLVDLEDDDANPLAALSAFTDVMAELKGDWIAEPLTMEQLTPIGSYRLF